MKLHLLVAGLALCALASRPVLADDDVDAVRAKLTGYEHVPTVQQLLVGRTPESLAAILEALARSPTSRWFVRARAVALLPSTGARRARVAVEQIALEVEDPMVLRSALIASARLGLDGPLVRRLDHPDAQVREVALRGHTQLMEKRR